MSTQAMRVTATNQDGTAVTGIVFHALNTTGTAGAVVTVSPDDVLVRVTTMTGSPEAVSAQVVQAASETASDTADWSEPHTMDVDYPHHPTDTASLAHDELFVGLVAQAGADR